MNDSHPQAAATLNDTGGIGGHPRGLNTLFFTEMWERFSYYGMRALLILFMVDQADGLGYGDEQAGRIYGLYTAAVYIASLPGGWVADRLIGMRKATLLGGVFIMCGHFSMAVPTIQTFYLGLGLIVLGTGLLKPNISGMVGELYDKNDPRRDRGYSIYYMGINTGAFLAPLICGYLGQQVGWHYGFAAAGVGMLFGLIQYRATGDRLGQAGLKVRRPQQGERFKPTTSGVLWLLGLTVILLGLVLDLDPLQRLMFLGVGSTIFISSLYVGAGATLDEKKRGVAIYCLFWVSVIFWSGFEQAGSSLNLFADRFTRMPEIFGWSMPSSWFQSANPLYILIFAPLLSMLWVALGRRQPSYPSKFGLGVLFIGLGFLMLVPAAASLGDGSTKVVFWWLTGTYVLHTIGELCLSPVGLSLMTKLSPAAAVGQIMGVWFLGSAIGNYLGGEVAGLFATYPIDQIFWSVALVNFGAAVLVMLLVQPIKRLMVGIDQAGG